MFSRDRKTSWNKTLGHWKQVPAHLRLSLALIYSSESKLSPINLFLFLIYSQISFLGIFSVRVGVFLHVQPLGQHRPNLLSLSSGKQFILGIQDDGKSSLNRNTKG